MIEALSKVRFETMVREYREATAVGVPPPQSEEPVVQRPIEVESSKVTPIGNASGGNKDIPIWHYLFVYGTLKNGFHNHVVLKDANLVSMNATLYDHCMIHLGHFPGIFRNWCNSVVKGEIYQINSQTLLACDKLEGVGQGLFTRSKEQASAANGRTYHSWVYKFDPPRKPYPRVTTGVWVGKETEAVESNAGVVDPATGFGFTGGTPWVPPKPVPTQREIAIQKAKYVIEVEGIFPEIGVHKLPLRQS